MMRPTLRCPCGRQYDKTTFVYRAPPLGETAFDLGGQSYQRAFQRCAICGHWYSDSPMNLAGLYGGTYVDATYRDGMRATFERILALPPGKSDNAGRVARVLTFAERWFPSGKVPSLLDVGAGLGVFPHRMKQAGWRCTALDPDPRAAAHAREVIGVDAVTGDFMAIPEVELGRFDVISFNKVLEHVEDPIAMLTKAANQLLPGGFIYIEVPDESAAMEGAAREEFFIEHLHVFSAASVAMLAERCELVAVVVERLREPSTKFTLRGFFAARAVS